jgi:iron(II)-dependent oxidoreductase
MSSSPHPAANLGALDEASSRDRARRAIAALETAREHTLALMAPLSDADAGAQHDPLMSPLIWDLGHIAAFETLWLLRNLDGPIEFAEMPGTYDPFAHPRATRGALALPTLEEARAELAYVRDEVRRRLANESFASESLLRRDGYVVRMVAQHESQHQETMLQTLQLKGGAPYAAPRRWETPRGRALDGGEGGMVRFAGGHVTLGTDDRTESYDNERPRHDIALPPFWIDVTPVTNAAFLRFVEGGGYDDRGVWSAAGWSWRNESGVRAPKHWERSATGWSTRTMDRVTPLDPLRPVCHVCYYEAEAYARSVDKRLPTEQEWEAAAVWDAVAHRQRGYPWGEERPTPALANVDQLAFETAQIGAYPRNLSPIGCYGMIGDVWEWTSSDFGGYPGYQTFPYPEYSEVFFGSEYKVLRGGSWATARDVARATFRNWDYPIRRQLFSGFRCARDV